MKTLLEAAVAMMAVADPDGDCTDLWAKDMRKAISRWTPRDPKCGITYEDFSMEKCVYSLIYSAANRFEAGEPQDFRVIARDCIDAAQQPLADQYQEGYEHGHADGTRQILENWNSTSHEEDAAWAAYNVKFSWGHEPMAKGLFIDGHRAAGTSIAKDAARYRYVLKHGVPFSRDVSYSDEQTNWMIDKALGCAVGDFPKRSDE